MPRKIFPLMVEETRRWFSDASGYVFVDYTGMSANDANRLRRKIGEYDAGMRVVKNSVAARVFEEMEVDAGDLLVGPTAVVTVYTEDDLPAVARVLREWKKEGGRIEIKGAVVDKAVVSAEGVDHLADCPPREQMYAMLTGAVASPMRNVASVLQGVLRSLLMVLQGVIERREGND